MSLLDFMDDPEDIIEDMGPRELRKHGCPHRNTRELSIPSPHHLPDKDPWAGKIPIRCSDCRQIVDRVEP